MQIYSAIHLRCLYTQATHCRLHICGGRRDDGLSWNEVACRDTDGPIYGQAQRPGISTKTARLCVSLNCRYASRRLHTRALDSPYILILIYWSPRAAACNCFLIAKLEDMDADHLPTIDALLHAAQTGPDPCTYSREEFQIMEMYTLKFFKWCITLASPAHFPGYFLKHCPDWAQGVPPSLFPTSVLNHADYLERRLYLENYTQYFIEFGSKSQPMHHAPL